jgi:hypothetical protein
MMKANSLFAVCAVCLSFSQAHAQQRSLSDMIGEAVRQCMAGQLPGARSTSSKFCNCWVNEWLELWDTDDRNIWVNTARSTPHMQQMERVAAQKCSD